jgi:2'-5' RNA ligase
MSRSSVREAGERWRCFVAVPIGEELRVQLAAYVHQLRRAPSAQALRWADPETWHVTLAFLGDTDAAAIPALAHALTGVAGRHAAFGVTAGALGSFPVGGRVRVLWYGIDDAEGRLEALAREVRAALHLEPEPGPFRPHLTLARARDGSDRPSLAELRPAGGEPPPGRIEVDRVDLYRSHLSSGPARHEVLASVPLRASPATEARDGGAIR